MPLVQLTIGDGTTSPTPAPSGSIEYMIYRVNASIPQDIVSSQAVGDLNTLAQAGWRVVSCSGLNNRMVWTLQRVAP